MTTLTRASFKERSSALGLSSTRRIEGIDGLRGIALTLVVLFHLFGNGRVSGGVDVFLVVSGFLLALSLGGALRSQTPVGVTRRWGRMFARLAPPAAVVLLFVVLISVFVLPPWTREQNLREVVAAALYFENWELIWSQLAYGAAGPLASPVQHFWSLSIQAQVFIVLPVLAFVIARCLPSGRSAVRLFWSVVAVSTVTSFAYAWTLNSTAPDIAYFDSFARFWELGVGALAASVLTRRLSIRRSWASALGWVGLALVITSAWLVDGARHFPGPYALLPVGGALLVIVACASTGRHSLSAVLSARPLRALDRISYPLYLWHWPLLITVLAMTGLDSVGPIEALVVLTASVLAALATNRLVGVPVAYLIARWLSPRLLLVPLLAIAVVLSVTVPQLRVVDHGSVADELGPCAGAAALDPTSHQCRDFTATALVPRLEDLDADDGNRSECWAGRDVDELRVCTLGPSEGYSQRLLAVGDSHNNSLIGAYEHIAQQNGWRIDVAGRGRCYWTSAIQWQPTPGETEDCAAWVAELTQFIAGQEDLDAVIVTHSSVSRLEVPQGVEPDQYRVDGLLGAWSARPAGVPIIAIRDNPIFPRDLLECLQDESAAVEGACSLSRDEALRDDGLATATTLSADAHLIDLSHLMCTSYECPLVLGGVVVVRDGRHLTDSFVQTLTPYLRGEVEAVVG
ncbi:acyltransferase family protein [Microbacterium chocolatum]|uniref:acyltransferase family protein n=1 Tax=Microbacterium aurantiacum TaxID=162393 RepID=UPI00338F4089